MKGRQFDNHSVEWSVSRILIKKNKRLFIIIIAVIILWLLTVGFALWQTIRFEEYKNNVLKSHSCEQCFTDTQSIANFGGNDMGLMLPKKEGCLQKEKDGVIIFFYDNEILL